jgi:hypothetical protein
MYYVDIVQRSAPCGEGSRLFFMFAVAALTFAATLAQAAPSGGVP